MTDVGDIRSLERLLLPLRRELNAEVASALLRMKVDEEVQARYDELAEKTRMELSPLKSGTNWLRLSASTRCSGC